MMLKMTKLNKQRIAGTLFFLAGVISLMGIITSEAYYPVGYSTRTNEISDLGATRPPESVSYQPSATIFNLSMMTTGVFVLSGIVLLTMIKYDKLSLLFTGLFGAGVLGVGIFPGNTGTPHVLMAMLTFLAGGVAAIVSSRTIKSPIRYAFIILGATALIFWFGAGFFIPYLGAGGTERWIAYPILLWLAGWGTVLSAVEKIK